MSYQLETQYSSPCFDTPAQAPYIQDGEPRIIQSITIHHWNAPGLGDTYESTIRTLTDPAAGRSAHFVVTAGRVACLVSPENIAWHAGNWHGNATSIGIECDPSESPAVYQTVAELIQWVRSNYGARLPLHPHSFWTPTSCPGTFDLARLDRLASIVSAPSHPAPRPALPTGGSAMTPDESRMLRAVYEAIFHGGHSTPGGQSLLNIAQTAVNNTSPILRDGRQVSLRQEIADTKTNTIKLLTK